MQLQLLHYDISDCLTIPEIFRTEFCHKNILIVLATTNEACEAFCQTT